ncbi:hypothetical protein EV186_103596 [Labedaea rhizosphaerae]|uniref:Uncharacterized protein n=1 Tax=Labedaea rhizosphaerae TaxID=598644 RepID=A0A4R6SCF9_LABRH|nr:hypothetical protein EV186_103596 [Labedaea rhizosphaerae]
MCRRVYDSETKSWTNEWVACSDPDCPGSKQNQSNK